MAHKDQINFCSSIKCRFPDHFEDKRVLDVGSLDINGNNNYLFSRCDILRIDLGEGNNVDRVCHGADLDTPDESYNTIISTEAFEHDNRFRETLVNIVRLLSRGGMFIFTCAANGRQEHGTHQKLAWCSPHTLDFYQNRSEEDVRSLLDIEQIFVKHEFIKHGADLYFWGIKSL